MFYVYLLSTCGDARTHLLTETFPTVVNAAARRSFLQCPAVGQSVWTREGKRRAVKTSQDLHSAILRKTGRHQRSDASIKTQVMTRISELPLWICEYSWLLLALGFVFFLRRVHVGNNFKTAVGALFFNVDSVCCQLGLWLDGACCAFPETCDKSSAAWHNFRSDFASKQRRRSAPRSGPLCPGTRAWLCCGWQHAGTVFCLQSGLLWAKYMKLFTGNSCVWLAHTAQ